jgi:hypothetical protein
MLGILVLWLGIGLFGLHLTTDAWYHWLFFVAAIGMVIAAENIFEAVGVLEYKERIHKVLEARTRSEGHK